MIVIDASAMVDALVGSAPAAELLDALSDEVHAPHLLDLEVMSVLRGLTLGRVILPERAAEALEDYWALHIQRYDAQPLAARVWELRHQFTTYDATYLALAEALRVPLVTCDAKLATQGHRADVELVRQPAVPTPD